MTFYLRGALSLNICILVVALCVRYAVLDLSNNAGVITRTYNITSWSGQWDFTGFDLGPTSGDHYYLLSYSTDNE